MSKNKSINRMMETVENIFEATHATIESMNMGERIQLKELAQTVGLAVAMEPKHVLGFVNYFVHNSDIAYVTRGKNGGVIKGVKPVKAVPVDEPELEQAEPADATDE